MTRIAAELLTVTFVDNGGITRAKTVPAGRAAAASTAGIGASTTFSVFTGLDAMGAAHGLEIPTGDLRLVADLDAHVVDGAWAWAPADLVDTAGAPWPTCARTFARRMEQRAAEGGLRVEASFESEFTAWHADGRPLHEQPAYGLEATRAAGPFLLAIVRRLQALGVEVDQVHPEYSPGQLEVSVGRTGPVAAADRIVLVRDVVRTVARELGLRVSFSAKPAPDSLGNGAHLHLSLWRGDDNLFGCGDNPHGMAPEARAFLAGLLAELPALVGVVCASPVSYLRLGPSRWTGAYRCWGLENREAPLRLIRGSRSTRPGGANVELKPVDASGNPYLAVGAAIAAGLAGIAAGLDPAPECTIDPATMRDADRTAAGLTPLPAGLEEATDALRASEVLCEAMGDLLHGSLVAVRVREHDDAMGISAEALCERYRFRY
ncbi:MAG: glutamine synthetase [Gaiellaceae bacterium]|nr:glutamine synthetase [Gaiellaceae bacterium]